ncbi:hypothetical protein K474DRAFT_1714124 [Panus rudis PR-1116 ss-1]|nr:hypothetical protein K474DRAFT_1714124 [Panus rudis PR-1116 ss-1]
MPESFFQMNRLKAECVHKMVLVKMDLKRCFAPGNNEQRIKRKFDSFRTSESQTVVNQPSASVSDNRSSAGTSKVQAGVIPPVVLTAGPSSAHPHSTARTSLPEDYMTALPNDSESTSDTLVTPTSAESTPPSLLHPTEHVSAVIQPLLDAVTAENIAASDWDEDDDEQGLPATLISSGFFDSLPAEGSAPTTEMSIEDALLLKNIFDYSSASTLYDRFSWNKGRASLNAETMLYEFLSSGGEAEVFDNM